MLCRALSSGVDCRPSNLIYVCVSLQQGLPAKEEFPLWGLLYVVVRAKNAELHWAIPQENPSSYKDLVAADAEVLKELQNHGPGVAIVTALPSMHIAPKQPAAPEPPPQTAQPQKQETLQPAHAGSVQHQEKDANHQPAEELPADQGPSEHVACPKPQTEERATHTGADVAAKPKVQAPPPPPPAEPKPDAGLVKRASAARAASKLALQVRA